MTLNSITEWKKTDKILVAILAIATLTAVSYTSIVLLDPYYGPCEYQYVASGKCQDNRAWHIQDAIIHKIHEVIRP